jgi:L-malate glycosyltransferase
MSWGFAQGTVPATLLLCWQSARTQQSPRPAFVGPTHKLDSGSGRPARRVLVTNFHPRGGGGHVTYIKSLLALEEGGDVRIAVATPETSGLYEYLKESGYPRLHACDFPGKPQKELPSIVRSIQRFRGIVADFQPDIVHVNGGPDLSIALWSHPLGKYRIVRTHHAIKGLSKDVYHRYIYSRRVSQNIYVSSSSMELAHSLGLVPRDCIAIPNGVDTSRFRPDRSKDEALGAQLGIPNNAFVFGSCAGVDGYKRVDLAIAAAARIKSQRPFAILAIGNEEDGRRLEQKAKVLGVSQFKYCGFRKDVRSFVSLLDVGFILSDRIETISFAAREMLAMGKPLISSSFSGLVENINEGYNGILVRPGDVDHVVSAMMRFLEMSSDELARFSANARSYAEVNFSITEQLQRTLEIYKMVSER